MNISGQMYFCLKNWIIKINTFEIENNRFFLFVWYNSVFSGFNLVLGVNQWLFIYMFHICKNDGGWPLMFFFVEWSIMMMIVCGTSVCLFQMTTINKKNFFWPPKLFRVWKDIFKVLLDPYQILHKPIEHATNVFSLVGCEKNRKSSIKLDHSLDHLVAVWSIFFLLQSSTAVFVWM